MGKDSLQVENPAQRGAQKVKNSVIYNIPQLIILSLGGLIPTLIRTEFYTREETEKIIQEYWAEKEEELI